MLCQQCEERRATLKFTKVVNGQKTEKHLCEFCAKEKGEALPGTNSYSIHDLLSGMLNLDPSEIKANSSLGSLSQVKKQKPDLACPKCSLKYKAFVQNSRFGCSYCYKAFEEKLEPILKRVHGGNHVHRGKIPKRVGGRLEQERKITKLQESMQGHIQKEEFEQAAMIRDEIRQLRSAVDKGDDE